MKYFGGTDGNLSHSANARSTGLSVERGGSGDVSIGLEGEPPLAVELRRRITEGSVPALFLGG